jgi:hypothetical protein
MAAGQFCHPQQIDIFNKNANQISMEQPGQFGSG